MPSSHYRKLEVNEMKVHFKQTEQDGGLYPGFPASFSLKQGVTLTKTSTYNFVTCQ